ncbi:poly-beta-1,6 N-acetyl-D-glucosamine export porin PgaA [Lysobacter auxotrophicus]|uniref:Poly-beta-1,6 N-acetyl-D-glucosamine export porin PgaA n=1 Tax=Lysobacter auxotrophicus TaxID=2992573 RepID=A0ABM8DDM1_9GAMM|nr:poly-beta-1,6 N-acetyl-D-glucosamine export porin PgaA [Lysobacter auxotrophicus]BDU16695.1 poly-beta-1,6 N-acetyl-D-glucosamine export porin PgaA [Lysobacter auxotrophicus]
MSAAVRLALSLLLAVMSPTALPAAGETGTARSFDTRMQHGRALLQAGDRFGALREFSLASQERPGDRDARRALADVLMELGAPQAAARVLAPEVDIGVRARLAGERVRWGSQVATDPAARFKTTDEAIGQLGALLVEARALPARDIGLERRLLGDLVIALRDRERWADALATADTLAQEGPLPSYVRQAQADALLAMRRPEDAIAGYQEALASDPRNRDARVGLFYAQVEAEEFGAAFATADTLVAQSPRSRQVGVTARPLPNPDWLDAQILRSQSRRYGDMPAGSWQVLHPLASQAPAAPYLRLEHGEVAGERGWPRLAHDEIRIAHSLAPDEVPIATALAEAEFERRHWREAERRARQLAAIDPGNDRLRHLQADLDAYRGAQLVLSLQPRKAEGGGLTAPGSGMSGALRAYTPPLGERWRVFAAAEREVDEPDDERLVRNRYGAGVEGRWPDVTLELVAWSNHGLLAHGGADASVQWQPDDRWTLEIGAQAFSSATPLRAVQAGIRADAASVSATHAWSASSVASLSATTLDFTDGNRRWEGVLDFARTVVARPNVELVLRPALYASRNSLRDAPYFNPERDRSVSLTADLRHRLWRRRPTTATWSAP